MVTFVKVNKAVKFNQTFLIILLILSGCSYSFNVDDVTGATTKDISKESYLVIDVIDGDTLDLDNSERVRLAGINAPEKGECYYQEAKTALVEFTLNKQVKLESDEGDKDKYGRLLRYIHTEELDVNRYLVEMGYVKVYDKYEDTIKRYDELKLVEQVAMDKKLGVWSCVNPTEDCMYVGSKNSDLYHTPGCKYALRIIPENRVCYTIAPSDKEFSGC